jgi:hypothetical protein
MILNFDHRCPCQDNHVNVHVNNRMWSYIVSPCQSNKVTYFMQIEFSCYYCTNELTKFINNSQMFF